MQTIVDGGIDALDADSTMSARLYGSTKPFRRMNAVRVSACFGASIFMGRATARGGTSAMVETGRAGASINTPRSNLGRGSFLILRCLDPKIGVHRIRTITLFYRPERPAPIGSRLRANVARALACSVGFRRRVCL